MKIHYTQHIKSRMALRRIDEALPEKIFVNSKEHYLDTETGYRVAVMTCELYGKKREVMVAYVR